MTAKYFAKIDVGSELEDRIHELLEAQTDGAQEDYATIRTGMFHLIIHYLDLPGVTICFSMMLTGS